MWTAYAPSSGRKHRLRARKYFDDVQSVTRAQRVLMLLVESGVAYCLLWVCIVPLPHLPLSSRPRVLNPCPR